MSHFKDPKDQVVADQGIAGSDPWPVTPDRGTKSAPTAVALASDPAPTAQSILAANTSRKAALLANGGSNTVYLGKDNTVTTANGQPLAPGAALTDTWSTDAWWGIMAANQAGDVRVTEVV